MSTAAPPSFDAVVRVRADGTIVDLNAAAERLYGYQRTTLIGQPLGALLEDPSDPLLVATRAGDAWDGQRVETTQRRRDGTTFNADATLVELGGGAGSVGERLVIVRTRDGVQHVPFGHDRRAPARLPGAAPGQAGWERDAAWAGGLETARGWPSPDPLWDALSVIVQHLPCGVLVFDTASCLVLANGRALEMLDPAAPPPDARPGSTVPHPSAILDGGLLDPCRSLVALALGGSVASSRELEVGQPGAGVWTLIGSAAPLRSARGEVRGAIVTLDDVTRERRLMNELIHSEGTLRHSLESLLVLHEAGRALSSTLVEEEIGRRFVESCTRIARLDAALVFLDDGDGAPRLLGADGDPLLIEHVLACPEERRVRARALRSEVTASAAGVATIPSCPETVPAASHHLQLAARGRTLGVLEIYGAEQLVAVTRDALASLAAHAVSAFENAHLYREVADREQRLQDALRQLLLAQEEERRRVAYELHDGLAQVAAATHMSLQTFASQYRPRSEQRRQHVERSVELARRVVREARQVIAGLRPTVLDDFGLERALRLHIQELTAEGWSIEYDPRLGPDRLPGPVETVLYRIAQEALTNVRKHARTMSAVVSLRRQQGFVVLEVVDHGIGFRQAPADDEAAPGQQIGLVGMRERAALVGGWCVVQSQPGTGTRVTAQIPLAATPGQVRSPAPLPGTEARS